MFQNEECLYLTISCSATQASFSADAVGIESRPPWVLRPLTEFLLALWRGWGLLSPSEHSEGEKSRPLPPKRSGDLLQKALPDSSSWPYTLTDGAMSPSGSLQSSSALSISVNTQYDGLILLRANRHVRTRPSPRLTPCTRMPVG